VPLGRKCKAKFSVCKRAFKIPPLIFSIPSISDGKDSGKVFAII
jgi:hypothetical protein